MSEAALGGAVVAARRSFVGAELGVSRRPGQTRVAITAAAGADAGAAALRVGVSAEFVLQPGALRGESPYGGLGVSFVGVEGAPGSGYLTAVLGVESAPARPRGWYVEAGLGGGVRVAAGIRWRRLPPGW